MPLADYYDVYYKQIRYKQKDDYGGTFWTLADDEKIMGAISKSQATASQANTRIAEAQSVFAQYNFITDIDVKLNVNDIIKRERDDTFYRVNGFGEKSPVPAESQFALWALELIKRSDALNA